MSKFLKFEKVAEDEYDVLSKGLLLGVMAIENCWRKNRWAFYPGTDTFYTNECLIEIAKFLTKLEE